jgi:hypothetical protein
VNVNGKIIQPRKIGGILKKNLNLVNIVLLTVSIPFIKKQKLSKGRLSHRTFGKFPMINIEEVGLDHFCESFPRFRWGVLEKV